MEASGSGAIIVPDGFRGGVESALLQFALNDEQRGMPVPISSFLRFEFCLWHGLFISSALACHVTFLTLPHLQNTSSHHRCRPSIVLSCTQWHVPVATCRVPVVARRIAA